ncbi:MAG: hypothetical protein HOV80_38730 [Polyangiaceae bacterium]|nr:hypothetical protein [Polyangiaceae bacterium]
MLLEITLFGALAAFGVAGAKGLARWRARGLEEDLEIARGAVKDAHAVAEHRLSSRPWGDPLGTAALRALVTRSVPEGDDAGSRLIRVLVDLDEDSPWAALTTAVVIEPPGGEAWGRYRAFVCARIAIEQARRRSDHPAVLALHRELEESGDLHTRAYAVWLRAVARSPDVPEEDEDVVILAQAKRMASEVGPPWLVAEIDRLFQRARKVTAMAGYRDG